MSHLTKLILFLMIYLTVSCKNHSAFSNEHRLLIDIQRDNLFVTLNDIEVVSGTISLIRNKTIEVRFFPVRGGFSSFLGYDYNVRDGDNFEGRLKIMCKDTKYNFSVNNILEWPTEKIKDGEIIYIAPKLCD